MSVENNTLYFCHSSKEKMHWLVNDLTSSLIFSHAKQLGCDYVHFHYYGKVSVSGGLTYIRNSIAEHAKKLREKEFTLTI